MKRSPILILLFTTACAHGAREVVAEGPQQAVASERGRDQAAEGAKETRSGPDAEQRGGGEPPPSGPQPSAQPEPTPTPAVPGSASDAVADADARARLVRAARSHLGRTFAGDCSTFVRRVYAEAGVTLPTLKTARTMTESLYRSTRLVPAPQPGDLAYFRRTRRRDRGGRGRERLTHVAIVEKVDGPSVIMIHRGSRGIRRLAMNLARPHDPEQNGIVRRRWGGERGAPSLAAELFAGYGTALRTGGEGPSPVLRVERAPPRADGADGVPRG